MKILSKKILMKHGKTQFSRIKESVCNIFMEAASICNILPKLAFPKGLIVVKLQSWS